MKLRVLTLTILWLSFAHGQTTQVLHSNWEFKMEGDQQWYPAEVPGTVHQDLMRQGLIEDVFFEKNEYRYQWIEEKNWHYRCTFQIPDEGKSKTLVFEGVDTYAQVFVDDSLLGETNNMFRTWEFKLSHLAPGEHRLHVLFISPYTYQKEAVIAYPHQLPSGSEAGALKVSPFCRKAAYHFGWDWAPRMVTCGLFRTVYLRNQQPYIKKVNTRVLALRDSTAFVEWNYTISGANSDYQIEFKGQRFNLEPIPSWKDRYNSLRMAIRKAKLWWPHTHGEPHLYFDTLRLYKGEELIDEYPFQYGLRTVELIQSPDSLGTPYYFKINGRPIFARGANYIPQDMLLPRVRNAQYRRLLAQAYKANMNMLRVWGGGVYEKDLFYHLCDSLGIMVWQDFMFAGTMYPADHPGFLDNVVHELGDNIARLSRHPSIVLWCGNNEIEVAWKNWGWQKQYGYSARDSMVLWKGYQSLFDSLIPFKLYEHDWDERPYVSTSPLSNWGTPENFRHGSMHYWGVWHGGDDFEDFKNNVGRFMVEYGFQSFPNYNSLRKTISPDQMTFDSEVIQSRQKSYIGNTEIERQVNQYFKDPPTDFKSFITASQKVQAIALKTAIQAHRAQQGFCMGSLLWQLNDCWPGPSWSIIDYYGEEKEAFRAVANGFRKNFWYVEGPIITFIVEEPVSLSLTLRYKVEAPKLKPVLIQKKFSSPGVYKIDLREESETKALQSERELRYIEAVFSNE